MRAGTTQADEPGFRRLTPDMKFQPVALLPSRARQPPLAIGRAWRIRRLTRERSESDASRQSAGMRSAPNNATAMSRCVAPAQRASWTRSASICRSAPRSRGKSAGTNRPVRHNAASRRSGARRAAVPALMLSVQLHRSSTGRCEARLPSATSILIRRKPSESTTCSRPARSATSVKRSPNRLGSNSSYARSRSGSR